MTTQPATVYVRGKFPRRLFSQLRARAKAERLSVEAFILSAVKAELECNHPVKKRGRRRP